MKKNKSFYKYLWVPIAVAVMLPSCSLIRNKQNKQGAPLSFDGKRMESSENVKINFAFLYYNACKEKMLGNLELATNIFLECIKNDPSNAAPYYELAHIYNFKRKKDQALVFSKKAAELSPENYWYQLLYTECLKNKRLFKEAGEVFQRMIKTNPYKKELYIELAEVYLYSGKVSDAIKVYDKIEEVFGPDDEIIMQKINVYRQAGDFQSMEKELINLVKRFPLEAKYHGMLGELYMDKGMQGKAYETYMNYLKIEEENPYIRLLLADYYRKTDQKEKALGEVKRAFKNPNLDIDAKMKMLLSYYEVSAQYPEMKAEAFELCKILVDTHPTEAKSHSIYGDFLVREKRNEEAREEFRKAISYDKEKFVLWNQLLSMDYEMNDFESLEKDSKDVMELFPSQPQPYLLSGFANLQLKKYEEAIRVLKEGIGVVADNKPLLSQFYSSLGDTWYKLQKNKESDEAYDKALELDPNNVYVLNNYSYYLSLRKENLDHAEKMSKRSLEIDPKNVSYMDTYGWIHYQKGNFEEAKKWIEKALMNGSEGNSVILEHYGDILFKMGDKEKALRIWIEARQKGSGSEFLDKKIADKNLYE